MFGINAPIEMMAKVISPKKAFSLVAHHLTSELKIKVTKFDLLFDAVERKVFFTVYSEKIEGGKMTKPFNGGEKYIDVAMNFLKGHVPENCSIHKAMVNYEEKGPCKGFLFFEHEGEKKSIEHEF